MSKSFTISNSTGHHSEEHSRRAYIPFSAEASLTPFNIVIYDCGDDREHLNRTAEPFIRAYNTKQKRKDRKKNYESNYVAALESGAACYGKGEQKEKPFHSDVIQIGNRDSLGITDENFDVEYWRSLKRQNKKAEARRYVQAHMNPDPDIKIAVQILKDVAEEIANGKYKNVLVHGLVIHVDEPNGTPHLDFRYSIFTDDESRGVSWRISDHKGLQKMGFETDKMTTALQKFRECINARIEEKMLEHGWSREVKNEHRKHLSTAQYEAEQRLIDAEKKATQIIADAESVVAQLKKDFDEKSVTEDVKDFIESDIGKMAYERYLSTLLQKQLLKKKAEKAEQETNDKLRLVASQKQVKDKKIKTPKHGGKKPILVQKNDSSIAYVQQTKATRKGNIEDINVDEKNNNDEKEV